MRKIHVSEPQFLGNEKKYVNDCLDRVELSWSGRYVGMLEKEFARFCGVKHAVFCSSGTTALHLAMLALGVKPGDRVLMPALTYIATANAVRYCGGVPVFCDVDPKTWCLDPEDVEKKLWECRGNRRRVVGILPVHLYGVVAPMDELNSIAAVNKLWVVEDAAEAHGATYKGLTAGALSTIGTFSFYGNKVLTSGEGGMVVTQDSVLAAAMRSFRHQGMTQRYWHESVGYNYLPTNIQAALALAQLERVGDHLSRRDKVMDAYRSLDEFETQRTERTSCPWMFSVLLPTGLDRDKVATRLEKVGVETRPVFYPVTMMPPYKAMTPKVSQDVSSRGLNLPTHAGMTLEDVQYVMMQLRCAVEAEKAAA